MVFFDYFSLGEPWLAQNLNDDGGA